MDGSQRVQSNGAHLLQTISILCLKSRDQDYFGDYNVVVKVPFKILNDDNSDY